jgi:hypothetical protein
MAEALGYTRRIMTRSAAISRRRFCLALAVATCACAPGRSAEPSPTAVGPKALPTVRALPTTGRLLVVHAGNFFRFDLASLQETPLSHFPKNAYAAAPALTPDWKRVAYGYYVIPADPTNVGGSDLYVVEASGGEGRLVRLHPGPDAGYEEPCWTADGTALLATLREPIDVQGQFQGERQSIVRVGLDGSEPIPLVDNGQSPTASPDGKSLAYLGVDTQGRQRGLWVADAAGRGARPARRAGLPLPARRASPRTAAASPLPRPAAPARRPPSTRSAPGPSSALPRPTTPPGRSGRCVQTGPSCGD